MAQKERCDCYSYVLPARCVIVRALHAGPVTLALFAVTAGATVAHATLVRATAVTLGAVSLLQHLTVIFNHFYVISHTRW